MEDSMEKDYAKRISTYLWERHWREVNPDWKPLNTLMGVLTQIDNMIAGLEQPCYICHKTEGHEVWCSRGKAQEVQPTRKEKDQPEPEDIIKMRKESNEFAAMIDSHLPEAAVRKARKHDYVEVQPTRKEWIEWVESMPSHSNHTRMEWERAMQAWFLTSPGVPK
jgi:hypothetical protein